MLKTFIVLTVLTVAGYSLVFACLDRTSRVIGRKPLYAVVLCYAAALLLPTLYLVHFCLFVLNPLLARSRQESFSIFLICFVMLPALSEPVRLASAYLFDVSAQTAVSLGALASLALRRSTERNVPSNNHYFFWIIFLCLLVITIRGGTPITYIRSTVTLLVQFGMPYACFVSGMRKADASRAVAVALSIAGGMLAMIALFEIRTSWPLFAAMNDHLGLHPSMLVAKLRGGLLRSAGPMSESTEMGFILVFCLLAALASRRSFRRASGYALTTGLIALGLVAPQSKGGWIGAGIGIIAFAAYRSTLARPGKFLAAIGAGGIFLYAASVYHPGEDTSSGSGVYRARLLERGMQEFWQKPLFGDNAQSVFARMEDMKQGEHIVDFVNSYLWFALTLGALGLAAIVIAFLMPIVRAWRLRNPQNDRRLSDDFAAFCFSCFIASMAMLAFTSFMPRAVLLLMMFSAALSRTKSQPPIIASRSAAKVETARGPAAGYDRA